MTKQEYINFSLDKGLKVILNQKGKFNLDEEFPRAHKEICEVTQIINCGDHFEYEISNEDVSYGFIEINEFDIITLPISDLTKPIEHNGKKFIPLVELAKIALKSEFVYSRHHQDEDGFYVESKQNFVFAYCHNKQCFGMYRYKSIYTVSNQLQLFQKLIEWKFNLMDESEPFIDVNTLETNPYK